MFNDGKNEYNFVFSKSTLYQRFTAPEDAVIIPVKVYENPWPWLIKPKYDEFIEWYKKSFPDYYDKNRNVLLEPYLSIAEASFDHMCSQMGFNID